MTFVEAPSHPSKAPLLRPLPVFSAVVDPLGLDDAEARFFRERKRRAEKLNNKPSSFKAFFTVRSFANMTVNK